MLNLFICDDISEHLQHEAAYIRSLPISSQIVLKAFDSPQKVIAALREGYLPDLAVLDIEMPKIDGITLAEKLNILCPKCRIIFLTGYTSYTYEAYYAEHIWYVLKTDMEKYLPAALKKAISCINADHVEPFLFIQQQRTARRLELKTVLFLERITYRTRIKTVSEELFVRAAPSELIAGLPPESFIRCHQSYWVNAEKISALVGQCFLLVDGSSVPISRTFRQSAAERFHACKIAE